ncbi:hypothetical protein NMY22_g4080 [Coprinellus aureogranulatus]|nr:hypothetical protein NMY22_g4080 [Coprinellus aureogranulatus]
MTSLDKLEEYVHSVEEYFFSTVSTVTQGLPDIHEVANKLWIDISRYGPGIPAFPEVHIPSLGDFQVPPPPPPPPEPASALESFSKWLQDNPRKASGVVVGVLGTGLLIGYRRVLTGRPAPKTASHRAAVGQSGERRQVVVVLGGDTPYGPPLIQDLEKKGYIVIVSVSTPDAVEALESSSRGYVKALVLNPAEPATVPVFLRSLSSTLSRKFPLRSSGDPYSSPASQPYIQSVISLLTLPAGAPTTPSLGPLEHISLGSDYLPYLNATQISPLQCRQGQEVDYHCLPAVDTHVALPFNAVQAMSAAGTLKAVEILRREIAMAAVTGKTDSMKNIRVVTVDVGSIDVGTARTPGAEQKPNILKATEKWTSSEKLIYGPAFANVIAHQQAHAQQEEVQGLWEGVRALFGERRHYAVGRRPTRMSVFVKKVVGIVSEGRGDRVAVGAGANTYKFASYLPSLLLEGLLNLPYLLIGLRNKLLPVNPHRTPPRNMPSTRSSRVGGRSPQPRRGDARLAIAGSPDIISPPQTTTTEVAAEEDEVVEEEIDVRSASDVTDMSSAPSSNPSVESSWINLEHRRPDDSAA